MIDTSNAIESTEPDRTQSSRIQDWKHQWREQNKRKRVWVLQISFYSSQSGYRFSFSKDCMYKEYSFYS